MSNDPRRNPARAARAIDQPPGIRAAWQALMLRTGDEHEAAHRAIDALAETVWEAQRDRQPPSNERYLERLRRAAGSS